MPSRHWLSSNPTMNRRNGHPGRRLGLESLERRDCPAVIFDFTDGVLKITGDEGPNAIEIFQPRDRVVEVKADGRQQTFEAVDELFIASLGGDDSIRSSKPKEIVVVGSKLNIDAGEGNDKLDIQMGADSRLALTVKAGAGDDFVSIRDNEAGSASGRITAVVADPIDASIDLGTGADDLVFYVRQHGVVDVDVQSADSFDSVDVNVQYHPLPRPIRLLETKASLALNLAGGGHVVDVRTKNVSEVSLDLSLSGGDNTVAIGLLLPAIQSTHESARMEIDVGGGGNLVDVQTQHVRDVELDVKANAKASARSTTQGGNVFTITFGGSLNTSLDLSSGGDDDIVEVNHSRAGVGFLRSADEGRSFSRIDLGAGNDRLMVSNQGWGRWELLVDAGDGDDEAHIRHRMFAIVDRTSLNVDVQLGAGSDKLKLESSGSAQVKTSIHTGPAGDGIDTISAVHQSLRRGGRPHVRRLSLDGGMDTYEHVALGYLVQGSNPTPIAVEFLFVAQ